VQTGRSLHVHDPVIRQAQNLEEHRGLWDHTE
jgi:hypothetical protein